MKKRPIIFSAPRVRAILAGQQTQTRRIVMPQPKSYLHHAKSGDAQVYSTDANGFRSRNPIPCPYGQPGDRLWVRETWRLWGGSSFADNGEPLDPDILIGSLASMREDFLRSRPLEYYADTGDEGPWRSPIHMPRWASRILLEITAVRVERLQEISEEDAEAEGVRNSLHLHGGRFARENFAHLWWTIYGDNGYGSWEANPWVWVIEFRRIDSPREGA